MVHSRHRIALMTLVAGALALVLVLAIASRHTAGSGFAGALLPSGVRAPAFHLRDQNGRQVSLDRELALARE